MKIYHVENINDPQDVAITRAFESFVEQILKKLKEQEFVKTSKLEPELEPISKMDSIPVEAAYLLEAQAKKVCQLQKEVDDLFAANAQLRRRLDEAGIAYVYNIKSGEWSFQCPPRQ